MDLFRLLQTAELLSTRLARLSVDSSWARRAGGLRNALLRCMDEIENGEDRLSLLDDLIRQGYRILENAAREIPDPHTTRPCFPPENDHAKR